MRLLLLATILAGCATPTPAATDRLPEVEAFRAELADPSLHPIRHGMDIDEAQLHSAVEVFGASHRELLDKHFRGTLDALPTGAVPAPDYGLVAEIAGADAASVSDATETFYRIDPDAKRLARTAISMVAPRMAQVVGLAISRLGPWMAFLAAAAPDVRICQRDAERALVCLDYGGLDIFVVTFVSRRNGWAAQGVAWRQRGRVSPG